MLVFDQLGDDSTSLLNIGLTCRAWYDLSKPCLCRDVNLSSHNLGRWHCSEEERASAASEDCRVIYTDYHAKFRPRNLVRRQRAFLNLISTNPRLARYVRSLTWTLIWRDFGDAGLTDADRQTWNVFSLMKNVARLDVASLHDVPNNPYVRQNPAHLFPKVTDLRLLGLDALWTDQSYHRLSGRQQTPQPQARLPTG